MENNLTFSGSKNDDGEAGRYYGDRFELLDATIEEIVVAIKAAPMRGAFDIKNLIRYDENILRVKILKIFDKSALIFSNVEVPYLVIAADEVIVDNPRVRAAISRPVGSTHDQYWADNLRGQDGTAGGNGAPGQGWVSRRGVDGQSGQPGNPGAPGKSFNLPSVWLFANKIRLGSGTTPEHEAVELFFDGLTEGNGGTGGAGGNGGHGAKGQAANPGGPWHCHDGGGNGGDGGFGGMPGRGGDAGTGGDGASVFFLAPLDKLDMLKFFSVRQESGAPGQPGYQGSPGQGARGGDGGNGAGACHGGRAGHDRRGQSISRPDDGRGTVANVGTRGQQEYIFRHNTDLF